MRRRRATPVQPLLNDATAARTKPVAGGRDRGSPPPPRPVPDAARLYVYRFLRIGASLTQIVEADANDREDGRTPFGEEIVGRAYRRYVDQLRDLAKAPEQEVEAVRALQVERVQSDLMQLRYRMSALPMTQSAVLDYSRLDARVTAKEELLADLLGTRKPIDVRVGVDVDVRVRSASMRIVSEMTADQFAEIGRELARVAG